MFVKKNVTIPFFPDIPSKESRNEFPEKIENGDLKGVGIPLLKSFRNVICYSPGAMHFLRFLIP